MKKTRSFAILFTAFALSISSYGQDFSNKGKDFWVGYGYHQVMTSNNLQDMVLYFATDAVTTVTVEIPLLNYKRTYTAIAANTIFESEPLPKSGFEDARLLTEGVSKNGIHITSNNPIVAYAHIFNQSVSGATLLFPTSTLGKEYYSVNFDQVSNVNNANCWVYAVAVDTGITMVEVIPSAPTLTHAANDPFLVPLEQGQVLNLMGRLNGNSGGVFTGVDLTGTKIRSVTSSTGSCKRIAVFSGSGRIAVSCNNTAPSSDNYIVQAVPKNAWGKKYLTVPTKVLPNNYYRICVLNPATIVTVNGVPLTGLIGGFYYQISTMEPSVIEANEPIMVAQIMTSQGQCGNGTPGDPEVIYLSPVEQNINKVIFNSTSRYLITQHWINVTIKTSAVAGFKLDGIAPNAGTFFNHPQESGYMYAQINVGAGQHTLSADSGFNAIAYGLGNAESYGYNAGTNVKDLYQFVSVQNQFATVNFPASCVNTPFFFSMTFPYQPTEIKWLFNGLFPDVTVNTPVHDSTWTINGKQLFRYRLPNTYSTSSTGTFPIKVIAQNPNTDGCGNEQEIDYDLQIFAQPTAAFNFLTNGCVSSPVAFTDASTPGGRPVIRWNWDFGDATTSAVQNPTHLYPVAGSYPAKLSIITDIGCVSNTAQNIINLTQSPTALFSAAGVFCPGTGVTFTNQSTSPVAAIAKWFWNFGDGSPIVTAATGT
ncbi:MAG TPA: PKD domain-containing protein, partial [Flavisolibacter sp.]|nr:PKD domain-containing protein [Flavisolibacter sp.]